MKVLLFLLLLVLGMGVKDNLLTPEKNIESISYEEKEFILTENQKEILREAELPENYEELTTSQKSAIEAMGGMIDYIEEKYGEEFSYLGYVDGAGFEQRHMTVHPKDGSVYDVVTIYEYYEDGEYRYEDDYGCLLYEPYYREVIEEYASQYFDMEYCKVYVDLEETYEGINEENVLSMSVANIEIFVSNEKYYSEEMKTFVNEYGQWLSKYSEETYSLTQVYLFKQDVFAEINSGNYMQKGLEGENIVDEITCHISRKKSINIF